MTDAGELTDFEQHIYNTHLKILRTRKNLPFKYRKDFSNIEPQTQLHLKRIAIFLRKFSHINVVDFITAPYKVYSDEEYFGLDYYTTLKATKAYAIYQNKKMFLDPDSQEQLENIKTSLLYISSFCKEQNIQLSDYIDYKTNDQYAFLLHLKEHRINVYCLFGFPAFEKAIKSVDFDLLSFIIGSDLINNLPVFRTKFFASTKARTFVELGINKLNKK